MSRSGKRRVWCYLGDRGNVVVSLSDPNAEQAFLDAVRACTTVGDVRRLNADTRGALEPAVEGFDEDGLADDDPWDITCMPGYEEGDWPPEDDLGMADLFTDEQVTHLVEHCGAELVDDIGGNGEALYIPDEYLTDVRALLMGWGFDVQQ